MDILSEAAAASAVGEGYSRSSKERQKKKEEGSEGHSFLEKQAIINIEQLFSSHDALKINGTIILEGHNKSKPANMLFPISAATSFHLKSYQEMEQHAMPSNENSVHNRRKELSKAIEIYTALTSSI